MLFTIPYNLSDPEEFLAQFEPYSQHIHSFYLGLPGILPSHNPDRSNAEKALRKYSNAFRFLEMTKGRFMTVLCLNTLLVPDELEKVTFSVIRELSPLVEIGGLKAVNVASPTLASIIHQYFPDLDIQTSCNTYTFVTNMYRLWNERYGSTVFNLPREAMRTPRLLEEFKSLGFVSKCIVNEGCIYGCPGNIEHACSFVTPQFAVKIFCDQKEFRLSDIYKSNFVPPHRLRDFEGKVDIAKIAGRAFPTERIVKIFKAYLDGDEEADLSVLLHSRNTRLLTENGLKIKAKDWPKKTLTCECKECGTCNICQKAMEHAVKRQGLDPMKLTRSI